MLGISPAFRSQATEVAARSGIGFDGHAFLLTGAVADQLVGAVMTVANASSLHQIVKPQSLRAMTEDHCISSSTIVGTAAYRGLRTIHFGGLFMIVTCFSAAKASAASTTSGQSWL